MGKRKPHPTKDPESARAYLVHERGAVIADEIVHRAEMVAEDLRKRLAPFTPRERKRALKAAGELRAVWRGSRYAASLIDMLVPSGNAARRGRRRDVDAEFSGAMLPWGASELGARGLRQLTVTELMAAAVASRLEPGNDPRGKLNGDALAEAKERMLDAWRKYHARNLPENPEALAETSRERLRLVSELAEAKRQLRGTKVRAARARAALRRTLGVPDRNVVRIA